MSNLMTILETEVEQRTPEQQAAIAAHNRLVYDKQMVEMGLSAMCRDLKEIRDCKYYLTLGYEEFGAYTEEAHNIGSRQAYKYIRIYERLGEDVLSANAQIGVTKLLQIATLDKYEREELLNEHSADELAALPTDEVKRLTEQVKKLEEQINFLEAAPKEEQVIQQPFEEIEADIRAKLEEELRAKYEAKIIALEGKTMSEEELKKYRANVEKEAKAKVAAEIKELKVTSEEELKKVRMDLKAAKEAAKAKEAAAKKAEEARKEAEEKAKIAEEKAARAAELEAKAAAAEAEKAAMEKQIKLSVDPEFTRFKFLFEAWQGATDALMEQLAKLDAGKQAKMKEAVKSVTEGMGL